MHVIIADDVDHALVQGMAYLAAHGVEEPSRNGPVVAAPGPVTTVYKHPIWRVLHNPVRDANPFFHLFEAIWMLAGRNDVDYPARFAKQVAEYTDDGVTVPGAYGHRWRQHFGYDQLPIIINELKANPASRRCVLAMWDGMGTYRRGDGGASDLHKAVGGGKDVPCNTHAYFRVRPAWAGSTVDVLDMTVCNRSNDVVWGAYGANAVHFSILQEFVAQAVGVKMGLYYQVSNNYHAYKDRADVERLWGTTYNDHVDRYCTPLLAAHEHWKDWLDDAEDFVTKGIDNGATLDWFLKVADPMLLAIEYHKTGDTAEGIRVLSDSREDWHLAGKVWLQRRLAAKQTKAAAP